MRNHDRYTPARLLTLMVSSLLLPCLTQAAETGSEAFSSGQQAFRSGYFEAALSAFRQAESEGLERPALYYNLGVTLYTLGRYSEAREAFTQTLDTPALRQLGQYNIGLCAEAGGEAKEAEHWWTKAAKGKDERLTELARFKLAGQRPERTYHPWYAGSRLALGSDDNVLDLNQLTPSRINDSYLEAMLYGGYQFGSGKGYWRVDGSLFATDYQTVDNYDMQLIRAGLSRSQAFGSWRLDLALGAQNTTLDATGYLTQTDLGLQGKRRWADGRRLRTRLRVASIDNADAAYAHLAGSRIDFYALHSWPWQGSGTLQLGYRLKIDDRDDLTTATTFTSYSATSHILRAGADYPINADWSVDGKLRIYGIGYAEANRLADGSTTTRSDSRSVINLTFSRRLQGKLKLELGYNRTHNDSNIVTYDYTRQQISAGISYTF